jgi:hypothetical protein
VRRVVAPLLLLVPPLSALLIPLGFLASCALGGHAGLLAVLATSSAALFLLFASVFLAFRVNPLYALLYPLGALVLLYIVAGAITRGNRVSWKGRSYTSA